RPPDAGGERDVVSVLPSTVLPASPLDPSLRPDTPIEGMLYLDHLGHEVGDLNELRRSVPTGDDDVLEPGPGPEHLDDLIHGYPPERHGIGEPVEEEDVVGLICNPPAHL